MDPKVPVVVLVLPKWEAPNPPTEPASTPKFDWVVVLVLPEWAAPNLPTKLALKLKFNWVVGCKVAVKMAKCYCLALLSGAIC